MCPDLPSHVTGQIAVFQHNVDSAKDCYIELFNAVCCDEHYPLAIFQLAEEHRDETVADQVLRCPLLEKDIRFDQEKNSVLIAGDLEDPKELRFELRRIDRQFPSRNLTIRPGLGDARQQNILNKGLASGAQPLSRLSRSFLIQVGHFRMLAQLI